MIVWYYRARAAGADLIRAALVLAAAIGTAAAVWLSPGETAAAAAAARPAPVQLAAAATPAAAAHLAKGCQHVPVLGGSNYRHRVPTVICYLGRRPAPGFRWICYLDGGGTVTADGGLDLAPGSVLLCYQVRR